MRYIFLTLLLFIPSAARACIVGPSEITSQEELAVIPEGYYGFKVKISSLRNIDGSSSINTESLPHDGILAEADVLENYGADVPRKISLAFGPCSIAPATGMTYYFLASFSKEMGRYGVVDRPDFVINSAKQKK